MLYLSLKSHYKTEQKNYSYTCLCLLPKMKPTLVSSDIAIYTVSSKATCEDIDSCPGNPTRRGAQVSNTSGTLTNTRIEVLGKLHCHAYMYLENLGHHRVKNWFAHVNFWVSAEKTQITTCFSLCKPCMLPSIDIKR